MINSKAQIVATIGPSSENENVLSAMVERGLDVVRFNFSWGELKTRIEQMGLVRQIEKERNRRIPIIVDLPGPRVQKESFHTYDRKAFSAITDHDQEFIKFGVEQKIDYMAVSFVGNAEDVEKCRSIVKKYSGNQKIIAKIERAAALEVLDEIIAAADAVMIARGDLGREVPLERIPFIQEKIIHEAKTANKPVITATQMLVSMVNESAPTRAEVTDVANAILQGSDALMLSEETAIGKYPIEAVAMMEKIILESERNMDHKLKINPL